MTNTELSPFYVTPVNEAPWYELCSPTKTLAGNMLSPEISSAFEVSDGRHPARNSVSRNFDQTVNNQVKRSS
jgi:hypothetical protein